MNQSLFESDTEVHKQHNKTNTRTHTHIYTHCKL